jgi:hypothetical protein
MKSSALVVCLFLGIAQASQDNLIQLNMEALERSDIRSSLQQQLRAALNAESSPVADSLLQVETQSNSAIRQQLQAELRSALESPCFEGSDCNLESYNHSFPAPILPSSTITPYPNPAPSSDMDHAIL